MAISDLGEILQFWPRSYNRTEVYIQQLETRNAPTGCYFGMGGQLISLGLAVLIMNVPCSFTICM
jgi:hypothetical protein